MQVAVAAAAAAAAVADEDGVQWWQRGGAFNGGGSVRRQRQWGLRIGNDMNLRKSAMWSKMASELEDITRISELNLHTPSSGC